MEVPPARPVGRPRTRPNIPAEYDSPEAQAARRDYMTRYKEANHEHLKAYYKTWRSEHRDQMRQANREYVARCRLAKARAKEAAEGATVGLENSAP